MRCCYRMWCIFHPSCANQCFYFWFQYIMSVSYIFERKQTNDAASKMEAKKINWLDNNSSDNNSSRYIFSFFSLVDPCFVIHFVGSGICLKIMISCSNEKIFGCLRANPNILLPLGVASRSSWTSCLPDENATKNRIRSVYFALMNETQVETDATLEAIGI